MEAVPKRCGSTCGLDAARAPASHEPLNPRGLRAAAPPGCARRRGCSRVAPIDAVPQELAAKALSPLEPCDQVVATPACRGKSWCPY